jgi:hypothetical protein
MKTTYIQFDAPKNDSHSAKDGLIKKPATNIGLAIWRLKCFYETFVQGSTAVILLNFCAKNPPHRQAENRCAEKITRHYKISNGVLLNNLTKESLEIHGITFTGQLSKIDTSRNVKFTLIDQVWLIMKSIFDNRTFSFSGNGILKENRK